jgi:hypothetical protein
MKLFLLVHKDDAALANFFKAVRSEKLTGFTVLPSTGVGRTSQKPLEEFSFRALSRLMNDEGERIKNVTVFSFIEDDKLPRLLELTKLHCTDIGKPGAGLYAVLPVEAIAGLDLAGEKNG